MSSAAFRALARQAAARYGGPTRFARHFAYGKLTGDPVFEHILAKALIPPGARILDLGCGQALLAALLATEGRHGAWSYRGIDLSTHDIGRARAAALPNCELVAGDIRRADFGRADVAVILDVLHYIELDEQREVLRRVRGSLAGGGTLLMRVADAAGGFRFRITEAVDLAVTRARGHRLKALHSVPLAERKSALEAQGYRVDAVPMSEGTPFANVLLVARYDSRAP